MDEKARQPPPYEDNHDVIVHQPGQGYSYPPPAAPVGSQVPHAFAATGSSGVYQNVAPPGFVSGGPQQPGGGQQQQQIVMMAGGAQVTPGGGVFFGGPPGSVVTTQPGMAAPIVMIPSHIVVGLDYLVNLDKMFVKQKIEILEVITGFETENKYEVRDSNNIPIFKAKEHSDCCSRNCLGPLRSFEMTIENFLGQEVMHFSRPFACQSCCCPCCLQTLDVYAPPGNLVGTVHQEWSICIPKYVVRDAEGKDVLKIRGPCVTCSCCGGDVDFKVLALDGETEVGRISKKWSGLAREAFTDADNFGISFPKDLTVEMKATLLGACMLIDFNYFETNQDNNRRY